MPKRGANGVMSTLADEVIVTGGDGRYTVYTRNSTGGLGFRIGSAERRRHTYRTSYKNTRIGYDRTHTCWSGEWAVRPGDVRFDSLRCIGTLSDVAGILLRDWRERDAS